MITNAKVSLKAVKAFEQAVNGIVDFTTKFDRGSLCLEELLNALGEVVASLKEKIPEMDSARGKLSLKIKEIEAEIARLNAQLNDLQDKLSDLESELSDTPETLSVTNGEGEESEIPNPAYEALEARISIVEGEISSVEAKLNNEQQKLDRANTIDGKLVSHIDAINGVIYALEEKKSVCKQLISELGELKQSNSQNGNAALEGLKKIEQIVAGYIRIKMKYNNMQIENSMGTSSGRVNININVSKSTINNSNVAVETNINNTGNLYGYSSKEIKEHQIKFDKEGHVSEYEGRRYGGKFNSYEDRIGATSANNTIWGQYEGERGESKFIPSERTVEGIKVKKILDSYGVDGIYYRNAEPEFEVCAEAVVQIGNMSEWRYDYDAPEGVLGNFTQADIACAALWNAEKRDGYSNWTPRMVQQYRKDHGLTWHEKCDMSTIVMVPIEINAYFKHIGGCSECRLRDAMNSVGDEFDE